MDGWYELMSIEELQLALDNPKLSEEQRRILIKILEKKMHNLEEAGNHED